MPILIAKSTDKEIDPNEVTKLVLSNKNGADVTFVGRVRNHDNEKNVEKLIYEAHPDVDNQILKITQIIEQLFPEVNIATLHRVGNLNIGDVAFVVATASAHRDEALNCCRALVESIKSNAPIWKNQYFSDGSNEWVNSP
jgi:molybdopterin synthase catalytic subunit